MTHVHMGFGTFAVLVVAACASTGQQAGTSSNENVITAEELRNARSQDLLSYIQAHRPRWLQRARGTEISQNRLDAPRTYAVTVFLDNSAIGAPDVLSTMVAASAAEVRYYSPNDAVARFGSLYVNGVIQVITRSN